VPAQHVQPWKPLKWPPSRGPAYVLPSVEAPHFGAKGVGAALVPFQLVAVNCRQEPC